MNTLISHFSSLWNNYFNYSTNDYSNQDITPGSIITTKDNLTYMVIGSNVNNDLVCCIPADYRVSNIVSKIDITKVTTPNYNLNSNLNKKVKFTYN